MMVINDYNDNEYDPIASWVMIIFIIKQTPMGLFRRYFMKKYLEDSHPLNFQHQKSRTQCV